MRLDEGVEVRVVPQASEELLVLEALLTTQPYMYDNVFTRRARAEGEAEGEARGRASVLLRILERRGVSVSEPARDRILACADLEQLDAWTDRALVAATEEDVLQ